jgi:hypothetical protein
LCIRTYTKYNIDMSTAQRFTRARVSDIVYLHTTQHYATIQLIHTNSTHISTTQCQILWIFGIALRDLGGVAASHNTCISRLKSDLTIRADVHREERKGNSSEWRAGML